MSYNKANIENIAMDSFCKIIDTFLVKITNFSIFWNSLNGNYDK